MVAYGWRRPELFEAYRQAGGAFVYLDLGWWDRKPALRPLDGYHKVVVNGREPSGFRRGRPADRFAVFGRGVAPWRRRGAHILIAGMSGKSAWTRGLKPQEWEARTVEALRRITDRPIVYRPKPSWPDATPIEGTEFSGPNTTVEQALRNCWAVVTLHSNVAVDALLAGVPVVVSEGVCTGFSGSLDTIERALTPDGREQLMADIAYCQWSVAEMVDGTCWRSIREDCR